MNCSGIRDLLHEYHRGWCEPETAAAVRGHLSRCPDCQAESRRTQSTLTLLHALPDLEPSPETWKKIEKRISPRKAPVLAFWARTAAAASIAVAILSFAVVALMPRARALPVVAETSKALKWNEPLAAARYTTLNIPDVGTLKLKENTTVRLPHARACVLESGEVFADILPSGRGFEIRTGDTTVRVHGTRFGVAAPATVYVVEGSVEVKSPRGSLELRPNQVAVGARLADLRAEDYLRWISERASVRLALDPRDRTVVTPGGPLKWHLVLETDALAPLYLGNLRDVSQLLSLRINDTLVPLQSARLVEAAGGPNGLIRLDVSHRCVIECDIDPVLFREKGTARVRAVFNSGAHAPEKAWVGVLKSNEITVEVR
jgi:anti-sigma factor RsiW